MRKTILLIVAGVLVVVVLLQSLTGGAPGCGNTRGDAKTPTVQPVVVVKRDIPPFTILQSEDLDTRQMPPSQVADNTFRSLRELVGKMTVSELPAGNTLRRADVIDPDVSWGKGDKLIFSFYVATAKVLGGQLRPGHHIDLLVTRPGSREEAPQSLWLARNLWVVGVQQASGSEVLRPTAAAYVTPQAQAPVAGGLVPSAAVGGTSRSLREGPANLVTIAAHPEVAKMIGDYLGAQLFEAWVYIRATSSSDTSKGRIDGVVFDDVNGNREQDRTELGFDEIQIGLADAKGQTARPSIKTSGGGQFTFEGLEPGNYIISKDTQPGGFVSLSPDRLNVYVAEGQNLHVAFAVARPTPTATPPGAVAQGGGKPVGQAVTTPQPLPPSNGSQVRVYMTDKEKGTSMVSVFGKDAKEIWWVAEFSNVPANTPYEVTLTKDNGEPRKLDSGTWKGGTDRLSQLLSSAAVGSYTTVVQSGMKNSAWTWTVSEVPPTATKPAGTLVASGTIVPTMTPTPGKAPNSGVDVARQR
jgi:Flp pilus assembly protein CpaB